MPPNSDRQQHRRPAADQRLVDPLLHRLDREERQLRIDRRATCCGSRRRSPTDRPPSASTSVMPRSDVLREREVVGADRLLLGEARRPDVADDADDRVVAASSARAPASGRRALSGFHMRRPIGSCSFQKRCASRSSMISTLGARSSSDAREEAAALERDRHRLEVARRDRRLIRRDQRFARRHRVALGEDDAVAVVAAERDVAGDAGRLDAGQRAHAIDQAGSRTRCSCASSL